MIVCECNAWSCPVLHIMLSDDLSLEAQNKVERPAQDVNHLGYREGLLVVQ